MSPCHSEDLTEIVAPEGAEFVAIRSPDSAEDDPDYQELGRFPTRAKAGGKVAPDLTPSMHRDPEAVLKDILEPNAAINPEFVSYVVQLTSGDTVTGVVLSQDAERIVLVDAEGKERPLARSKVAQFRSSALSLMPEGFKKLGDDKLRDLVAFLCSPGPK